MMNKVGPPQLNDSAVTIANLDRFNVYPNIWVNADSLAKSMYSSVMADLGQSDPPNIVLNATALQHFTANFNKNMDGEVNIRVGPANDSFAALQSQTGPLGTTPAVVFTKYSCQVPRRKSTGSLFVSILIADLVFMQALWKVFSLIVGSILCHNNPAGKSLICVFFCFAFFYC